MPKNRERYYSPSKHHHAWFTDRVVKSSWFKGSDWEKAEVETPKSVQAKKESVKIDKKKVDAPVIEEKVLVEEELIQEDKTSDEMVVENMSDEELNLLYKKVMGKAPHHKKSREKIINELKTA